VEEVKRHSDSALQEEGNLNSSKKMKASREGEKNKNSMFGGRRVGKKGLSSA